MSPALQADSLPAKRELSLNGQGVGPGDRGGRAPRREQAEVRVFQLTPVPVSACPSLSIPQPSFPSLVPSLVYAGVCGREGHKMRLVNRARARQREGLNIGK